MLQFRLKSVAALVTLVAQGSSAVEYEYRVSQETMSQPGAKSFCQEGFMGELVSIESQEEKAFVRDLTMGVTGDSKYWIGLERANTASGWEYNDGADVKLTLNGDSVWVKNEPNNFRNNENCVSVKRSGLWNDANCLRNFYAVCKRVKQLNPFITDGWHARASGAENGQPINCYYKYYNNILNKKLAPFTRQTWFDAEGKCNAVTGLPGQPHLASIANSEENGFVRDMLTNTYREWTNRPVWIGARKVGDKWGWSDGEDFTYTNWLPGEPTHDINTREGPGFERCAQMSHSYIDGPGKESRSVDHFAQDMGNDSSEWNDASCYKPRGYVCELCTTSF